MDGRNLWTHSETGWFLIVCPMNKINLVKKNKTAAYHRHFFCPPILVKMPFKNMKVSFYFKEYCFFMKFNNIFASLKFFRFFAKNLTIKVEKTFSRSKVIWYALCIKSATFGDLVPKLAVIGAYINMHGEQLDTIDSTMNKMRCEWE